MKRILSLCMIVVFLAISLGVPIEAETILPATEGAAETELIRTRVQEVEGLRETNAETYLMSDGTYECVVYAEDKYYWDDSGDLLEINNSIVPLSTSKVGGPYKNTGNSFDVYFSSAGTPTVTMQYRGRGISFSPTVDSENAVMSTQPVSAMAVGKVENCSTLGKLTPTGDNTVRYANAFGTADLVYVLTNSALKEYIILENNTAPTTYRFAVSLDRLTIQQVGDVVSLVDEGGSTVFTLGSLFAVDAAGVMTDALTYTVTSDGTSNGFVLTITLDSGYLNDTERAFPVVIDPSVLVSSSQTADASVSSEFSDDNYYLNTRLWTGRNNVYGIRRSYLRFAIPSSIPSGSVTSATLDLEYALGLIPTVRAYKVTQSWSSSTITWDNKPASASAGSVNAVLRSGSNSWYSMDVTTIVKAWNNGEENYGFEVRDINESDATHWTDFYSSDEVSPHKPELHITYAAPVTIDRLYSTYSQTASYRSYMTSYMNCYGYALHVYSLSLDGGGAYKQQPGEFAADGVAYSVNIQNLGAKLLDTTADPEETLDYIEGLMYADFAALSSTGSEWTLTRTTSTATVPAGYRKIALTIGQGHDYHFYVRHSDGSWSHKQGAYPITNLSIDTGTAITDANIATIVQEGVYDDGVRYYLINKPLIADYPHRNGHGEALQTHTVFSDRAGDTIEKSTTISGSVQLGRFDYPTDKDYYAFTPTTSGTYSLTVLITDAYATDFDVDMMVYNAYENLLVSDLKAGKPVISMYMTAGVRYFVCIWNYGETVYPYEFTYELQ